MTDHDERASTGDLRIVPLRAGDVAALTDVMTRSFDDDARRHLGVPKGGPPGYDTGAFLHQHGFDPRARAFVAVLEERPVGAIIVFPREDGHHVLGCMFTDPERQRRGIGSALFAHVEAAFPAASWTLETPGFATSNHLFYAEKCGFGKVGERDDPDGVGTMFVFEKTGRGPGADP
jgi:GNAT superfamily N-acetyltransferase